MSKRIPFNIKYRPQIESGEYKVETRDGKSARIVCWDKSDDCEQHIVALVRYSSTTENMISVCNDGIYKGSYGHGYDLFIVTPEPDRTEFEKAIWNAVTEAQLIPRDKDGIRNIHDIDEFIKKRSAELLAIAREQFKSDFNSMLESNYKTAYKEGYEDGKKEVLKDLPRWKKIGQGNNYSSEAEFCINGRYLEMNDTLNDIYEIFLKDLEKLPKEDEK